MCSHYGLHVLKRAKLQRIHSPVRGFQFVFCENENVEQIPLKNKVISWDFSLSLMLSWMLLLLLSHLRKSKTWERITKQQQTPDIKIGFLTQRATTTLEWCTTNNTAVKALVHLSLLCVCMTSTLFYAFTILLDTLGNKRASWRSS